MPTSTLNLTTLELAAGGYVVPVPTEPVATPAGQPTDWVVKATDMFGNEQTRYPNALVRRITWTLNSWETAELEIPLDDDISDLALPNELQIWRNGHLLFWGPVVTRQVNSRSRTWDLSANGVLWYFSRRHHGDADRHDFLAGAGNFEAGLPGFGSWQEISPANMTTTADTSLYMGGTQSAQIVTTGAYPDPFIYVQFHPPLAVFGIAWELTAWIFLDAIATSFANEIVLELRIANTLGELRIYSAVLDSDAVTAGGWYRVELDAELRPLEQGTVQIRCYAPVSGTVHWDDVSLQQSDADNFLPINHLAYYGSLQPYDQAEILDELINTMQGVGPGAFYWGSPNEKTFVNVQPNSPLTGILKNRVYPHDAHPRFYAGGSGSGSLDDFCKADDGVDIRLELTPTTRTFIAHYPNYGTIRDDITFVWHRTVDPTTGDLVTAHVGVGDWSYGDNILTAANQIVELSGWGTAVAREEGSFIDPAALGGVSLEHIESAPQDATPDLLDALARERGDQLARPIATPTFSLFEPKDAVTNEVTYPLIGVLQPGDTISMSILDGTLAWDGTFRIARISLDCTTETLDITPNEIIELGS